MNWDAAGLIDSSNIDSAIFGTGKFYKEKQVEKKEDIYENIDEMLGRTLESRRRKSNKKVTLKFTI